MPGAIPGFCNLECWCHVPTRGVHKPPCYLCVIDCCSLSSKKEATPSAPSLSELEVTDPPHLPPANEETETQPDIIIDPRPEPPSRSYYGWQETLQRSASLDITNPGIANSQIFFSETYINLPPEPGDAQPVPENPGPSREAGSDHFTSEEIPEGAEESRVDDERPTTCEDQATESEAKYIHVTKIQVNSDPDCIRPVDLAELLRNVMIDPRDPTDDEDEEEDTSDRPSVPSLKQPHERSHSRRRRDTNQGMDKYQSFCNTGAKPYLIPKANITRHQSLNGISGQSETEFQRQHKIHRRDTSSDAARRYLQSDENLHRTWWKQVSSRKRNHSRRHPSSKRHEGGSHRSLTNFEEMWRS